VTNWLWLSREFILAAHDRLLAEYGGADGILDLGALDSALARPKNLVAYGNPKSSDLGASYAIAIAKAHAFVDGNKRTAWAACRTFLRINGFSLVFNEPDAVVQMVRVARDEIDADAMAAWLHARMMPVP
jgi:death on curing protein